MANENVKKVSWAAVVVMTAVVVFWSTNNRS